MFGLFSNKVQMPSSWKEITSSEELLEAMQQSEHETVAFFKHSTSCFRSAYAKHRLAKAFVTPPQIKFYYIDLLAFRHVSNQISDQLQLTHQSPQLILVHKRKVVYHASHESINWEKAMTFIPM